MYRIVKFKFSRHKGNLLWGAYHCHIQIFKFQKMCIYIHDDSHIISTSFEMFHLEKVQH
jgi:hypothetical protein